VAVALLRAEVFVADVAFVVVVSEFDVLGGLVAEDGGRVGDWVFGLVGTSLGFFSSSSSFDATDSFCLTSSLAAGGLDSVGAGASEVVGAGEAVGEGTVTAGALAGGEVDPG